MKQMTKNEIFMIFLKQLEQNNILERIMSNDEIVRKLNEIVRDITYHELGFGKNGTFELRIDDGKLNFCINFDINKIAEEVLSNELENELIIHELLHALFAKCKIVNNRIYYKTGLQTAIIDYVENSIQTKCYNKAINEGMTDFMAMKITGINSKEGYNEERETYYLCSIIVGEDAMLEKYADDNIQEYFFGNPYNIFWEELVEKYGVHYGMEVNDGVKKILALSDELLDVKDKLLNENSKKIYTEIKQEIQNEFVALFEKIIDKETDFTKKVDIMKKCFGTSVGKEISKKVLNEIVEKDDMDIKQKIDIFHQVREIKDSYIDSETIEKLLCEQDDGKQFTSEEKLKEYIYLCESSWDSKSLDTIFKLYVESGRISNELFDKKTMFTLGYMAYSEDIKTIEELDDMSDKQKYCKIGEYYVFHSDNIWIDGKIFDNNGQSVENSYFKPQHIAEYLKNYKGIQEQYKDKLKEDILNKCITKDGEMVNEVRSFKNMIGIRHEDDEEFYEIDSNGNLQKVIQGEERRIRDDMSELDLKLQKQTEGVSMIEINEMLEDMELPKEEKIMGENENGRED